MNHLEEEKKDLEKRVEGLEAETEAMKEEKVTTELKMVQIEEERDGKVDG